MISFCEHREFCSFESFYEHREFCSFESFYEHREFCSFESFYEHRELCFILYLYFRVVSNTSSEIVTRASWALLHILFLFSRCFKHVKWNRNIIFFFLISRLEKSIFSMFKIKKSSSFFRRRQQLNSLSIEFLAMRFCKNCTQTSKQCRVAKNCEKCVKCVQSNRFCDLVFLNIARWRRLKEQRRKFKIELKESLAKQQRLFRQIDYVKKKQRVMMNEKLRNIEKLKKTKQHVVDKKIDSLIDVISKQIVFFNDFDEWFFTSFFFLMIVSKFFRAIREIAEMFSCAVFDRIIFSFDEIFLILLV